MSCRIVGRLRGRSPSLAESHHAFQLQGQERHHGVMSRSPRQPKSLTSRTGLVSRPGARPWSRRSGSDLPVAGAALTLVCPDTRLKRLVSGGVRDGDLRLWARPPKARNPDRGDLSWEVDMTTLKPRPDPAQTLAALAWAAVALTPVGWFYGFLAFAYSHLGDVTDVGMMTGGLCCSPPLLRARSSWPSTRHVPGTGPARSP